MTSAAKKLVGLSLENGWHVVQYVDLTNTTGGCFSEAYIVENSGGHRAFLKALDYSRALRADDPARELQAQTASYNFERRLLRLCRTRRFDRVVLPLTDGTTHVEGEVVQYIIFELADGDLHTHAEILTDLDLAWKLRSLHHVATGLRQLHTQGIAHQDVKPSNVLVFNHSVSKVTDLGRSAHRGATAPHDDYRVAGDKSYAPPELLYGHLLPDWNARRFGCDLYLLGSMIPSYFVRQGTTPLLYAYLHPHHTHGQWTGDYRGVLPYIRHALGQALDDVAPYIPEQVRDELLVVTRQLCEPDPDLRGHPRNRAPSTRYSLDRYVTHFDLLARRAELSIWRG